MSPLLKSAAFSVLISAMCVSQPDVVAGESYPIRPVRVVTQAAAGSAFDVLARVISNELAKSWPSGVVIENKPGAGGVLAAQAVATAPKDGYTLLHAGASFFTILPAGKEKPSIDPDRAFSPVAYLGDLPLVIAVPKANPATTLGQLIADARKAPGSIVMGTNSAGSFPWFAASQLMEKASAPMTLVPYASGGAPAILNDLLGGRLHVTIEAISGLKGALDSGDLRALAVTTPARLPGYPGMPAVAETVPGFSAIGWSLIAAPAGTPVAVTDAIERAVKAAMGEPKVKQQLTNLNVFPREMTAPALRKFIAAEQRTWWPRVKAHAATANK